MMNWQILTNLIESHDKLLNNEFDTFDEHLMNTKIWWTDRLWDDMHDEFNKFDTPDEKLAVMTRLNCDIWLTASPCVVTEASAVDTLVCEKRWRRGGSHPPVETDKSHIHVS